MALAGDLEAADAEISATRSVEAAAPEMATKRRRTRDSVVVLRNGSAWLGVKRRIAVETTAAVRLQRQWRRLSDRMGGSATPAMAAD
ncbi:hypothetical protein Scep_029300 [Stephania cephalantha]|uniref:Uncharacterized protein n=1 Tax=Stephania cephalantha TaxID=152367 RepID=A0AAP0HDE5_9MAGN